MKRRVYQGLFEIIALISLAFGAIIIISKISTPQKPVVISSATKSASDSFGKKHIASLSLNKTGAYPGFTLYPISGPDEIQLLNMQGQAVHQWSNIDADRAKLLPDCNLLVLHGSKNRLKSKTWKDMIYQATEYNWEGKEIWKYRSPYHIHHDIERLENGNMILLLKVPIPESAKTQIQDPVRKKVSIEGDRVIEITPTGQTVWQWDSWDHIDLNDCGAPGCLGQKDLPFDRREQADIEDWTHINSIQILPKNKWFDAGDQRFKPGNLLIMPRNFWQMMIIDRVSGDIVWRSQSDYKGGMIRGHEASMVEEPMPGAGNILVLDNGFDGLRTESYILESNPVTQKSVWVYDAGKSFYTYARGSVQRLPNGNTLISEDREGRVFEVNPEKEIVWEYRGNLLVMRVTRYQQNYCPKLEALKLN